jgi:hypothetical protein
MWMTELSMLEILGPMPLDLSIAISATAAFILGFVHVKRNYLLVAVIVAGFCYFTQFLTQEIRSHLMDAVKAAAVFTAIIEMQKNV